METLKFGLTTTATLSSLYWAPLQAPETGRYVPFEPSDDGLTGKLEVAAPGDYVYILVLRGGQPDSKWELAIERPGKKPLKRSGTLDGSGEGGRVAELSLV